MKKFLVIRFSSIGDIVLTSPVVRCLKEQVKDANVHYITKKAYASIVSSNPHIDKVYSIEKEIDEVVDQLKDENYDFIIDLHHNLRTFRLKQKLSKPSGAFPKLNVNKFLLTTFKWDTLPDKHIVDRYFEAAAKTGVVNDQKGLDYFIPENDQVELKQFDIEPEFVACAIGAQYATKKLPEDQLKKLLSKINSPVVLLGGKDDMDVGERLASHLKHVISLCGKLNLNQSASVLKQAQKVITHDTGLMHIASAFQKPIVSIWGNTVPEFGMYPYTPQNKDLFQIHEVKLSCRPCSKIGYQECPKKHFNCMNKQDIDQIASEL